MKLATAAYLLCYGVGVVSALRPPTQQDVEDIMEIIVTEIEESACPTDNASVDFHVHWDRNGMASVSDPRSDDDVDCVLYPHAKGPRPLGAKLIRLAHADAAGVSDGFVNLADRANNGGLESAVFLLDAMYESGIELDSSGDRLSDVISKADFYAWAGSIAAYYMASFTDDFFAGEDDLPKFPLKWGRKTYVPTSDVDRGPVETFVPASTGWAQVADYFSKKFGFDERQSVTLMGAHSVGSALGETKPPYLGYWTAIPEEFDTHYYDNLSSMIPPAVHCGNPFDSATCEELPGCDPHVEPLSSDLSILKAAALKEEDGGGRCHGWEQIKNDQGSYQWSHSCDKYGNGCYGVLLNVDVAMQYDIDHYVDATTGKVTSLPVGSACGDFVEGMRVFVRCFKTKDQIASGSSSDTVLDHHNDKRGFIVEFASVYGAMMSHSVEFADGKGLYDVGDKGSFTDSGTSSGGGNVAAPVEDIPNGGRCPIDSSDSSVTCLYESTTGNPFLCLACHSGICGIDDQEEFPTCREKGWKPTNPPPPPPPPKEAPAGHVDTATLDECPVNSDDVNSGCYYKMGETQNPFICFHCETNICGLDIEGNFLCRPRGWTAKHAALPKSAPVTASGTLGDGTDQIITGQPCPFQSDDVYGDCFVTTDYAFNPFSCHACETNVCGVGDDGQALCRDPWWCPGDVDEASSPGAVDENGKLQDLSLCPKQTDNNGGDCYFAEYRNPFPCDACSSGICGVDYYDIALCRPLGWELKALATGEICPLGTETCPEPASGDGSTPFRCTECATGYCGIDHFGDPRCVAPSWTKGVLADGEQCPFEEEGCLFSDSSGWPCNACASNLCAINDNGDALCTGGGKGVDDSVAGGGGGDGACEGMLEAVPAGMLCELFEMDPSSGCYYDGTKNPFNCCSCKTGVCGVDSDKDAICVEEGWAPGQHSVQPSMGSIPSGHLCELDETSESSGCYYDGDGTPNPFMCLSCASGVCGVDSTETARCVDRSWKPVSDHSDVIKPATIPSGRLCELDESSESSGCYYSGEDNPFTCLTCESGICGVDDTVTARCVDEGWSPGKHTAVPPSTATSAGSVAVGSLCYLDESGPSSGCYYDGTKNPFTCLTCASGVCGVDNNEDALCVDLGWTPGQHAARPDMGAIPSGNLCELDESSESSGCYYDGADTLNPFMCLSCSSGVCGVDSTETARCVDRGWTPSADHSGLIKHATVPNGHLCELDESSESSGCYYSGAKNPFICMTCESGVCGVDSTETARCVDEGWTPAPDTMTQGVQPSQETTEQKEKPSNAALGSGGNGMFCELDESDPSSGCYYDGTMNPFVCTSCSSGVCGVDNDEDAVCVELGWKPGEETEKQTENQINPAEGLIPTGRLCVLDESDASSGCYYDGAKNPFKCLTCSSGLCGVDVDEDAVCVEVGWQPITENVPNGKPCPAIHSDDCHLVVGGSNPFLCLGCESAVCGVDHFGKALCRERGWEAADLQDGELCPYHKHNCLFQPDAPNPWKCDPCASGFCGEDSNGDAKCVKEGWSQPSLQVGDTCPFKRVDCFFQDGGPLPWQCDACDSGWCNINTYGDATCFKYADEPLDNVGQIPLNDFCPYHQVGCQVTEEQPNPWPCTFCESGICGEDASGNALCRPAEWAPPKRGNGESCPTRQKGCIFQEGDAQPWACEACESGWCNTNSYGDSKCIEHSENLSAGMAKLALGEYCPYHQEDCHVSDQTPNAWPCSFCASGICGEDTEGVAKCQSSDWVPPKLKDGDQCPLLMNGCIFDESSSSLTFPCDACESKACAQDSYGNAKCVQHGIHETVKIALDDGEPCIFTQEGCLFDSDSPNPWPCKFCNSGKCGEDDDGDALCRSNDWKPPVHVTSPTIGTASGTETKGGLKVGEPCPLNLIDQDSGCYYDSDEISRPFLCEGCETNMCGVDSSGQALCRAKGWTPPSVRGRARLRDLV